MQEIIKIKQENINNQLVNTVSAKELYEKLGLDKSHWYRWYKTNIIDNEFFIKNVDWIGYAIKANGNDTLEFIISLDFAKHLAMQAKSKKSHQIRNYFIECEKKSKQQQIPQTLPEALRLAADLAEKNQQLQLENKEMLPKVEFYEAVTGSNDTIDMGQVAKVLNMGIGRNNLFELLRQEKILMSNNTPMQRYIDAGYFRCVESSYNKPDGSTHINIKTVVFQKGLDAIRKIIITSNHKAEEESNE